MVQYYEHEALGSGASAREIKDGTWDCMSGGDQNKMIVGGIA